MSDPGSRSAVEDNPSTSSSSTNKCVLCKFKSYINANEIDTAKTFELSLKKASKHATDMQKYETLVSSSR